MACPVPWELAVARAIAHTDSFAKEIEADDSGNKGADVSDFGACCRSVRGDIDQLRLLSGWLYGV